MQKKFKIITVLILSIIFISVNVYGEGNFDATDISINKNQMINIPEANLQSAIKYLYDKANEMNICPDGYDCTMETNQGYLPGNDNNTYTQSTFVQNLQVGDLIKMTPLTSSVRLDGLKSGDRRYITSSTYLNPSELQYWRIIRKNNNGTIDVVSEYLSSVNVILFGLNGYANYIGYLNELASYYENPTYTIGSRYMGYNGQTEYIVDTSKFDGSSTSAPWTTNTSSSTTSANEALGAGDMGYETDYNLVKNAYTGTTYNGAKTYRVGTTTTAKYWLASRDYIFTSNSSFGFTARKIDNNGSLSSRYQLRYYYNDKWNNNYDLYAIRPILTLKADVTSSGTEEETGAYILG